MPYQKFTWTKAKQDFGLTTIEGGRFLPDTPSVAPSDLLRQELERNLPWALTTGSEKARSEGLISPILLEVREILKRQISVFSGERFDVDPRSGLNGYCDFLVSRSPEQIEIEAPVIAIVEAKRDNIKSGLGQCVATMVASQRFNQSRGQDCPVVYGSVSTGTAWRFLKLEGITLTLDVADYAIPPVDRVLGMLVWIVQNG